MSRGVHNDQFLTDLFNLPGIVTYSFAEDMTSYFWNPDKPFSDPRYVDYLIAAQGAGIFPDLDRRVVTFDVPLLMRTFPAMRRWKTELEELRPLTFNAPREERPRPVLRVIQGGLSAATPEEEAV